MSTKVKFDEYDYKANSFKSDHMCYFDAKEKYTKHKEKHIRCAIKTKNLSKLLELNNDEESYDTE